MDLNTEVQSRFQEQNSGDFNKMCYWIKPCCADSHKQIRKHIVNLFGASWPYILAAKWRYTSADPELAVAARVQLRVQIETSMVQVGW
jgi:hypothetical protein